VRVDRVDEVGARRRRGAVAASDGEGREGEERDRELAGSIGEAVRRMARRMRQSSAKRLELHGLTDAQARALRLVGGSAEALRMSDVARRSGVVARSATTVVAALEEKGLVRREMDLRDRRSVVVRLTASGSRLWQEVVRDRDDEVLALLAPLSRRERELLLRLLLKAGADEGAKGRAGRS
jgi:DNA-binding MarR family transcriptional regulator